VTKYFMYHAHVMAKLGKNKEMLTYFPIQVVLLFSLLWNEHQFQWSLCRTQVYWLAQAPKVRWQFWQPFWAPFRTFITLWLVLVAREEIFTRTIYQSFPEYCKQQSCM